MRVSGVCSLPHNSGFAGVHFCFPPSLFCRGFLESVVLYRNAETTRLEKIRAETEGSQFNARNKLEERTPWCNRKRKRQMQITRARTKVTGVFGIVLIRPLNRQCSKENSCMCEEHDLDKRGKGKGRHHLQTTSTVHGKMESVPKLPQIPILTSKKVRCPITNFMK